MPVQIKHTSSTKSSNKGFIKEVKECKYHVYVYVYINKWMINVLWKFV